MKVFISGSRLIDHVPHQVEEKLDNIMAKGFDVLVGDADGADRAMQLYLRYRRYRKVKVYCSSTRPRYNEGGWGIRNHLGEDYPFGSRAFYTEKDNVMASEADIGLAMWDCGSAGTLNNVINLLSRDKIMVVFLEGRGRRFKDVRTVEDLEELVSYMPDYGRVTADKKIKLSKRIEYLKSRRQSPILTENN